MQQVTASKKPLLLFFPKAQISNYNRCLALTCHLRTFFTIQSLHLDACASNIYQAGFDTFSSTTFPSLNIYNKNNNQETDPSESSFLELIQLLEHRQPSLVIGDGLSTLGMACEYTGIPYIALINGYQCRFSAVNSFQEENTDFAIHNKIREKYGLQVKQSYAEQLEGDLNWICDLSEIYPQIQLPSNYEILGPLYNAPAIVLQNTYNQNQINKKIIYLDLDEHYCNEYVLKRKYFNKYSFIISGKNKCFAYNILSSDHRTALANADLVITNNIDTIYQALHLEIPVLTIDIKDNMWIDPYLQHYNVGAKLVIDESTYKQIDQIEDWIYKKNSSKHKTCSYQFQSVIRSLGNKLEHSLSINFPMIFRQCKITI